MGAGMIAARTTYTMLVAPSEIAINACSSRTIAVGVKLVSGRGRQDDSVGVTMTTGNRTQGTPGEPPVGPHPSTEGIPGARSNSMWANLKPNLAGS